MKFENISVVCKYFSNIRSRVTFCISGLAPSLKTAMPSWPTAHGQGTILVLGYAHEVDLGHDLGYIVGTWPLHLLRRFGPRRIRAT